MLTTDTPAKPAQAVTPAHSCSSVIPGQTLLHEYLQYADSTEPMRLMLQSWFLSYCLDQSADVPDILCRQPIHENILFFQAMDDFLFQAGKISHGGTNEPLSEL